MRQQLEIIVVSEIDLDKQAMSQTDYEERLTTRIKQAVEQVIGTPYARTEVEIEYGDPV